MHVNHNKHKLCSSKFANNFIKITTTKNTSINII